MPLTKKEIEHLPPALVVQWCPFCEAPDYAANKTEDVDHETCPRCEHRLVWLNVKVVGEIRRVKVRG